MNSGSFYARVLRRILPQHVNSADEFRHFEEPIRAEIFSLERLEQHAESLAKEQVVTRTPSRGTRLSPRVRDNGHILLRAYREIAESIRNGAAITPAAEWLVDNFHIVDEQLRDIRDHLPPGYYAELPKLARGHLQGYPRVYGLAWGLIAHSDSRFDPESLRRFVDAYQRVQPLTIGELWAVPITLRVVLIENLRRLAVRIVGSQLARREADAFADLILGLDTVERSSVESKLEAYSNAALLPAFAVQLVQRLRYQDPKVTPALGWLERRLAAQNTSADDIVVVEHNNQSAANVTVRNIITSMRLISAFDWAGFVEDVSHANQILCKAPGFVAMDFVTRDRYRHGVEDLARGSDKTEVEIARRAVDKVARLSVNAEGMAPNKLDLGYYLISRGRVELEREVGFRPKLGRRITRAYVARATLAYLGTIMLLAAAVLAWPLTRAFESGIAPGLLLALALLGLFPALEIGVVLINRLVPKLVGPRHLPRLKLEDGVPPSAATFVVVPTLLGDENDIREQAANLEIHYLANPEGECYFALLSDWHDAPEQHMADDTRLLDAARDAIAQLNAEHGKTPSGYDRFYLLHRERRFNAGEGKWIGWERKRGKLHEFNRLIRREGETSFLPCDTPLPHAVRYVVTLDADTKLPRGAVYQMVGAMEHPLNRPRFDPATQRICEGYGILQPRVTPSLPTRRESTIFQRLYSGPCGIDPYAAAVSDVYQDLFGEGSYTGKGIYDIEAFEKALRGRVPENRMLSHDLFEGIFARTGFLSDVELFEDFPSHAAVAFARNHRWTRGDWQLLPWILNLRLKIPPIARWKMIDNLRRSVSAPAMLGLLVLAWLAPSVNPVDWMTLVAAALATPALLPFLTNLIPQRKGIAKRGYISGLGNDLRSGMAMLATSLTLLAHQTWTMIDAITRALWRLFISRRHLLEWTTAAQAKARASANLYGFFQRMRASMALSLTIATAVIAFNPNSITLAAPLLALWLIAPVLTREISLPPPLRQLVPLSEEALRTLRLTARRTWRFFSTFVTAEDNHLPPDNFQEDPHPVVAHRSSPTNFGLYLLSVIAARDFGWIGLREMAERLSRTLTSMEKLERYRGHFYNWYQTSEMRALEPRYISSVDSGNLAGHLWALAQACEEALKAPLVSSEQLLGLTDDLRLINAALSSNTFKRSEAIDFKELSHALHRATTLTERVPQNLAGWLAQFEMLNEEAATIVDICETLFAEQKEDAQEIVAWARAFKHDVQSQLADLEVLFIWHDEPDPFAGRIPDLRTIELTLANNDDARTMRARDAARALREALTGCAARARALADEMDFRFLFNQKLKLFSIGYRVGERELDASYYDLLASEARLTSFVAIAKGEVPATHWFRLGRALTPVAKGAALISWSGSMFEYLMPALVMRTPAESLLENTSNLVVWRQIEYATERGIPWGISESAYNVRDMGLTYQYSNFGVPGLGLKRGLADDLVIAPYATMLAAMYQPAAAARNLRQIELAGGRGPYGYYEALDFTRERVPQSKPAVVIRAYMAHHQGMSLVAIDNVIHSNIMRRRFHREPRVQAAQLLLQERTPRDIPVARPRAYEVHLDAHVRDYVEPVLRRFQNPNLPVPPAHLLSNGRYAVMVTAAGAGYSVWQKLAITRWREDVTRDAWGTFIYLRDPASGEVWSAGHQPTCVDADEYEAVFAEDRARFTRRDGTLTSTLEIIVSPEDDVEIRRLSLANGGLRAREIEVTSYCEIALASQAADAAHPAFSNLFIQTEYVDALSAIVASRRPRSAHDTRPWFAHVLACSESDVSGGVQYETDRARFVGRGRNLASPVSVMDARPLSNTVGAVLDPIASLRRRVRIPAGMTVHLNYATMAANSREEILSLADKYHDCAAFERASTLAWTHAQVQLHYLGIGTEEAHLFQRLASRILYIDPSLRPSSEILQRNTQPASALWPHRISGDLPIVLVRTDDADDRGLMRQLLRAHEYWRMRHLAVDLVVINEKPTSYAQDLQGHLETMIRACRSGNEPTQGGIYLLRGDLLSEQDRYLLQSAARAILTNRQGSLSEQVSRAKRPEPKPVSRMRRTLPRVAERDARQAPKLEFFNGLGGFANDGSEYVIVLGPNQRTPAPWINVIANPECGFIVSESGSSYTWTLNSRENQLTPWSNDPVSDPTGEAFYIRDEETGALWTPTALPIRLDDATYIAAHGQGYSRFEHNAFGITSELTQFVASSDPVKISILRLTNTSARTRNLSVTGYVEWVLGFLRSANAPHVVTERDASGALFAHNPWNAEFGRRIAFFDCTPDLAAWTADRSEFIGRNSALDRPAALLRNEPLSGRTGAGIDPCAALQATVVLKPGETREVRFMLGQTTTREAARELLLRTRAATTSELFTATREFWNHLLGAVKVSTPERSLDILVNRWLPYQTLSCRFWARTAFYQAGGAYGFRDQLQDSMALMFMRPQDVRAHILRVAEHQFVEGDVQHWWHPPSGRGVRTRISDDLVWLPYVVAYYVGMTDDKGILDEIAPFLEGPLLAAEQEDAYFPPHRSEQRASLYEHCARALERSLATGAHGLPLIGSGDWNDGMNRVGHAGRGESVWLAWFFYATLQAFAPIARARGDEARAAAWLGHAEKLREAAETHAWDGVWYRRAFFDDGTPLGTAASAECRIDSIAQTWAVISRAADPERARQAMRSVDEYLIHPGDDLVLLFTPPFDKTSLDPGYIKGYLPGVRENGGQYTHAAVWCVIAYAMLGDGDKAMELFNMMNPINHGCTRAGVHRYKVEPYVAAADVYAVPPHTGRGGWTWYTGSAGWMLRAGIESILGLKLRGTTLEIDPCIPRHWSGFTIDYRHGNTHYEIRVDNPHNVARGVKSISLDGQLLENTASVPLSDDAQKHRVLVELGG